jgi:hypothetical protein
LARTTGGCSADPPATYDRRMVYRAPELVAYLSLGCCRAGLELRRGMP